MCRWQNRRKCTRRDRRRAAGLQGRGSAQEVFQRPEVRTIPRVRRIVCATWRAIFRVQTRASDKSRNRLTPTGHFVARLQATCNARKIRRHMQLTKTTTVPSGAPPERAEEKSNKTGAAWKDRKRVG